MPFNLHFKQTWLHKTNPSMKLLTLMVLFIYLILMHNLNFMILFTIGTFILFAFFTGQTFKQFALFSIPFVFIFLASSTAMVFFGKGETTLFKWGLIHITEESLIRGLHLGLRALVFSMLGLIFAITTKPNLLFYSLMQQLKLKPKYAYSFMASVRLIPLIIEEVYTIRNAHKVRGVKSGVWKSLYMITIPLLSLCIRRAFRIAVAMEAKGFTGSSDRTYYYQVNYSRYDVLFIMYFIVSAILALAIAHEYPFIPITDVRLLDE